MKILVIIIILIVILAIWLVAHILYKPVYDKIAKEYVINEDDFKLANICIAVMLGLSFVIGLLLQPVSLLFPKVNTNTGGSPDFFSGDFFVYYSMTEIIEQGEVNVTGTVVATGTTGILSTKITTMKFYNPLAYTITLERYNASTATTNVLYEFNLDAGDSITDTMIYALNTGDTLTVYSSIPGTTYYFFGVNI